MSDAKSIEKICGCDAPSRFDFVFLHGLTGDAHETWTFGEGAEKQFWPPWLCEDFPDTAVYTLGYPAGMFQKWAKKELNLHERAEAILEDLATHQIGQRPLALITHSLGGLLAKEMLRVANECQDDGWKAVCDNTKLVCFLATPHTGTALAGVANALIPRLSSTHVTALSNDSGYLTALNKAYRDLAAQRAFATVAYYEKQKTKNAALVVSAESADPGVTNCRPIAIESDHIGICKLKARDELVYRSLQRHLSPLVKDAPVPQGSSPFAPSDYTAASEADRRDLLQKLIDAGREHEYPQANDLQNRFARDYYRLGLHTEAKQQSDAVLSQVEQRFITHVFHEKICKDATDDEIKNALQAHVIDAISATTNPPAAQAAVLQALYFLTERCHIRWDKP
ncbi:MAG TPA: ABC-three component system protein [Rhizomicrobium sp.]|nr:ABC-three component system protein [Rhizomicrobium sp.]